ncbi:MAG TPA: GNAT family N-acetyltransferase [Longimicrobiales bacterium]|nr:GNAT family N-acetyltransferase [Longimicrobiales bacterium]
MITGRWGKPSEVLLDIVAEPDGVVRGVVNPGRQDALIRHGRFDSSTGAVHLEGDVTATDGAMIPFRIDGRLDGRTLRLMYRYGELQGTADLVRVEEYKPPRVTLLDRLKPGIATTKRSWNALFRPRGDRNRQRLRDRSESLDSILFRDAVVSDIPALAELHVTTWNATYRTTGGPTVATRCWQWNEVFRKEQRRDFVLILEDQHGRLVGFTWGRPHDGEFAGELSKIYLRWEYHGLGLGRRMLAETARRFLERGIDSFVLFAELSNPTVSFFDHMGGERLYDERGLFSGAFAWRDVRSLLE